MLRSIAVRLRFGGYSWGDATAAILTSSHPKRKRTVFLALACTFAAVFATAPNRVQAAPAALTRTFEAHLAAGEFAPALSLAQQVADHAERDQWFAQIAAAQAAAGMRQASLRTARMISDGNTRSRTLQQLPAANAAAGGGGSAADFDPLIDLITTTINPESWDDVGGPGAIDGFASGVYVNAAGLMKRVPPETAGGIENIRRAAKAPGSNTNVRRSSSLRKVSLTRLEREVEILRAAGRDPSEAMQAMAGIQKIQYVFVYPETGDIVIAGPAGDWNMNTEGRRFNTESGRPVLNLDDFVVTLRNAYTNGSHFGCSIKPRQEALAQTKAFLETSARTPLKPSARARQQWLDEFRGKLGKQDIVVDGVDARTRLARVMVEADYRMKLVGMGLEPGVPGVNSYLSAVKLDKDGNPPPMSVLRWWFSLNYKAIAASPGRDGFEIRGQGAKVQSENEMLTDRGERVHTGTAEEINREFTRSFTTHFEALARRYPIYADLQNIFDLAMVSALIKAEDLPARTGWKMTHFGPSKHSGVEPYQPALETAPTQVETVINHRMMGRTKIIAGVSGGVAVHAAPLVAKAAMTTAPATVISQQKQAKPTEKLPPAAWWWD